MKKILCIGDSLALPRPEVTYEDTWFYKLKQQYPAFEFISVFKRAVTTNILVEWGGNEKNARGLFPKGSDLLEFYNPNIVVLQLGIVDCAPRLLKKGMETAIVKRMPDKIATTYIKLLKKLRGRSINNTFVTKDKFKKNLINYFDRCKKQNIEKLIIIKISIPTEDMILKNPKVLTNVNIYNEIYNELEKEYSFINCVEPLIPNINNEDIYLDGYHPNKFGNDLVFKTTNKIISEFKNN